MDSPALSFIAQQLLFQLPLLLATLVGAVLSLVFWKRAPGPSAMTLVASAAILLSTIAFTGLNGYLLQLRVERGWSTAEYSQWAGAIGLLGSTVRGLGTTAIIAAVFMGRPRL